jgi:hypothetical protein
LPYEWGCCLPLVTFYKREIAVGWSFLSVGIGVGDKAVGVSVRPGIVPII